MGIGFAEICRKFRTLAQIQQDLDACFHTLRKQDARIDEQIEQLREQWFQKNSQVIEEQLDGLNQSLQAWAEKADNIAQEEELLITGLENMIHGIDSYSVRAGQDSYQIHSRFDVDVQYLETLWKQISKDALACRQQQVIPLLGFQSKPIQKNETIYLSIYRKVNTFRYIYRELCVHWGEWADRENKAVTDRYTGILIDYLDKTRKNLINELPDESYKLAERFRNFHEHELGGNLVRSAEETWRESASQEFGHDGTGGPFRLGRLSVSWFPDPDPEYRELQDTLINVCRERYGTYNPGCTFSIPVCWQKDEPRNLILEEKDGQNTSLLFENILLRELCGRTPGEMEIRICSGSGSMHMFDLLRPIIHDIPSLTGGRIFVNRQEIGNILSAWRAEADSIIQNRLSGYQDITEYNRKNPAVRIPYRALCICDFPVGFDSNMISDLRYLIQEGYRSGFQVLLGTGLLSTGEGNSMANPELESLLDSPVHFCRDSSGRWKQGDSIEFSPQIVRLSDKQKTYLSSLKETLKARAEKSVTLADLFAGKGSAPGGSSSAEGLVLPFAMNGNGKIHCVRMGDHVAEGTSHFGLVIGPAGSGKSILLHTIILSAIRSYAPDEMNLYLLDFKSGVEFEVYARYMTAHMKCIALDSKQEFGESILEHLIQVMEKRTVLFKKAGIVNLEQYRKKTGKVMPRILVVIDEFQILFDQTGNKKAADHCANMIRILFQQARFAGIHFIFATQSLSGVQNGTYSIGKEQLNAMQIRIGLQLSEDEKERLFGPLHAKDARSVKSARRGSGIFLESDGSRCESVQIAFCEPDKERPALLAQWKQAYDRNSPGGAKGIVFQADSIPVRTIAELKDSWKNGYYVGLPVSIEPPVRIDPSGAQNRNLLLCGDNKKLLRKVLFLFLIQAQFAEKAGKVSKILLLDGGIMQGSPLLSERLRSRLQDVTIIGNAYRVLPEIEKICELYEKRKKQLMLSDDYSTGKRFPVIHLVINECRAMEPVWRLLMDEDISAFLPEKNGQEKDLSGGSALDRLLSGGGETPGRHSAPLQRRFRDLLENGASFGIHTVMCCTDQAALKNMTSQELVLFPLRFVTALSTDNEFHVLGNSDVSTQNLQDNMALFYNGIDRPKLVRPFWYSR